MAIWIVRGTWHVLLKYVRKILLVRQKFTHEVDTVRVDRAFGVKSSSGGEDSQCTANLKILSKGQRFMGEEDRPFLPALRVRIRGYGWANIPAPCRRPRGISQVEMGIPQWI